MITVLIGMVAFFVVWMVLVPLLNLNTTFKNWWEAAVYPPKNLVCFVLMVLVISLGISASNFAVNKYGDTERVAIPKCPASYSDEISDEEVQAAEKKSICVFRDSEGNGYITDHIKETQE